MSQIIELHATRDFGRKLNAVIEFIRQNFKSMGWAMLVIAGPFILLGSMLMTEFMNRILSSVALGQAAAFSQEDFGVGFFISIFAAFIFLFFGTITLISTVNQYVVLYEEQHSNTISVSDVWKRVRSNMWAVMGTMMIFLVAIIGIYVVMIILMGILSMIHPVLIFLSVIIIYGLLLFATNLFFLVLFVQAYEKKGFNQAIGRAMDLLRGHWWSTLGIVIVAVILQSVISTLFILPLYANMIIAAVHDSSGEALRNPSLIFQTINYLSMGVYLIANYLLYCLPLLAVAFQYFHLVEKKEAHGLMGKIENFGVVETSGEDEEHY